MIISYIVKVLINKGAKVGLFSDDGETALMIACQRLNKKTNHSYPKYSVSCEWILQDGQQ